jgi:hypothetical protein
MSDFDDFMNERKRGETQQNTDSQMLRLAASKTPVLFRSLVDQLDSYIQRYTSEGRRVVRISPNYENGTAEVSSSDMRWPSIFLKLERNMDGQPIVHVAQTIKRTDSASNISNSWDIEVIAKGQEQYFWSLRGELMDHAKCASALLIPLLRALG